jgi:hypothetical protein
VSMLGGVTELSNCLLACHVHIHLYLMDVNLIGQGDGAQVGPTVAGLCLEPAWVRWSCPCMYASFYIADG